MRIPFTISQETMADIERLAAAEGITPEDFISRIALDVILTDVDRQIEESIQGERPDVPPVGIFG